MLTRILLVPPYTHFSSSFLDLGSAYISGFVEWIVTFLLFNCPSLQCNFYPTIQFLLLHLLFCMLDHWPVSLASAHAIYFLQSAHATCALKGMPRAPAQYLQRFGCLFHFDNNPMHAYPYRQATEVLQPNSVQVYLLFLSKHSKAWVTSF